jgi:UDP-N-acetyl-D-galactosamine dehydrogenase
MFKELIEKKKKLAVVGLGYVGLPIALEFARKLAVIGFDIKADRIELMKKKIDPSNELSPEIFDGCDILFTSDIKILAEASFYIIAVPTPINQHKLPDLEPLIKATETVSKCIKHGDYVVYESTVYPGCTEEDCIPILEQGSGLVAGKDFKVGYSPERINPGDTKHALTKILKVTSGIDDESARVITDIYKLIITAGVYQAGSIKVAEAAKIIENTQRDINIAFMNELSMIFNLMNINTYEVLEAAGTKWNFLPFIPGLVGGHCIGVDPYYLSYKAKQFGHHAIIINSGRAINDGMGSYIAREIIKKLISSGKDLRTSQVLIMGITFKENVSDIRNSKVVDVVREFTSFGLTVDVTDPRADGDEVKKEYGLDLISEPVKKYDVVVLAVNHKEYTEYPDSYYADLGKADFLFVDIKGIFRIRNKFKNYWSL